MQKIFTFVVNGFKRQCQYNESTIENLFLPLLKNLAKQQREKSTRTIIFLAAPPAVGKTTLSLLFEQLSQKFTPLQALSLDGFHHRQSYLTSHTTTIGEKTIPLAAVKGSPETYDITALKEKLGALKHGTVEWPIYDRTLHDVSTETITANKDIILIEGNWLLLDEHPWNDLKDLADYTIFITAEESTLKPRLIERKILGGLSQEAAENFYESSDKSNIHLVLDHSSQADITLSMTADGDYIKGGNTR